MEKEYKQDVPILLVEDDEDDVHLTQRAFKKGHILNKLYVVSDGEEAMEFLEHCGRYSNPAAAPEPGVILLDLNMPRMNGREVLKKIKANDELKHIPVVILTTSDQKEDIRKCYDIGANTFITKPVEFSKFLEAIVTTGKYWLSIAKLAEAETVAN
ncbi:MAG: response regulator [Planctomycetes bacterium]|nr:response regulator [Planctomycetota bacterium]